MLSQPAGAGSDALDGAVGIRNNEPWFNELWFIIAGGVDMQGSRRWSVLAPALLMLWIVANIDKLDLSIMATNRHFLVAMGLIGREAAAGFLLTAFTLAMAAGNLVWGPLVDRLGGRTAVLWAVALWSAAMVLGGLAPGYGTLLASRAVLGLSEGALWPLTHKFMAHFEPAERGRAESVWLSGLYLGPAVAAPLTVGLMHLFGWRAAFVAIGLMSFLVTWPVFRFGVPAPSPVPERRPPGRGAPPVLARGRFWGNVLAYVSEGVVFFGIGFWLPTYLETVHHLSSATMAEVTAYTWVAALVAVIFAGSFADRRRRAAPLGGGSLLIAALMLLVAAESANPVVDIGALTLALAGSAVATTVSQVLLQRETDPAETGRAAGVMVAFGSAVGGWTATIMGALIHLDHGAFTSGLLFLVAAALIGGTALWTLGRGEVGAGVAAALGSGRTAAPERRSEI